MRTDITVILFSAALFLAIILYLALELRQRRRIMSLAFFTSAIGGIVLYGFA